MNKYFRPIIGSVGAMLLLTGGTLPVFAKTSLGINAGINIGISASSSGHGTLHVGGSGTLSVHAKDRADQEITRRINALTELETRINAMKKLSADEKSSLSAEIQAQITLLNGLQAKIVADANSTSSLKADIKSITDAYRIFSLVIPQGRIQATTDRILAIGDIMTTLAGQLQTKISAAQTAGKDMSAAVSALAEMNAKVADASVQAQAAVTETSGLKPDNGDKTIEASNKAALKDARAKTKVAEQDLVTARMDAGKIVKALVAADVRIHASSTVSSTVSH